MCVSLVKKELRGRLEAFATWAEHAFERFAHRVAVVHEAIGPECWPPYL
jgi:hypothetical protein